MKSIILVAICAIAFACGGSVDPAFAGAWVGTATFSSPGQPTVSGPLTVTLSVVDGAIQVPGCTAGADPLIVHGDGRSAEWRGRHTCATPTQSCSSATLTTVHYTATLVSDTRLTTTGESQLEGCGASLTVFGSFSGSK